MLAVNQSVKVNIAMLRALSDTNLSPALKETHRKLSSMGRNSIKITKVSVVAEGLYVDLQAEDSFNNLPAVMSEGYNGGQGICCYFENKEQAECLFSGGIHEFMNISDVPIIPLQLVRLIYNNGNLFVIPVTVNKLTDYHGVIGRAAEFILSQQTGKIAITEMSKLMDHNSFHKLTVKGY